MRKLSMKARETHYIGNTRVDMSGCNDPGASETAEASFRSCVIDGGVGGTGDRRGPGDGDRAGDESVALVLEPC